MNNIERKEFWDVLCSAQDGRSESIKEIQGTIKKPDFLCRFRSVNKNSLIQLQENKLYYSSADYYDDPFDTFIHVDIPSIKQWYEYLQSVLYSNSAGLHNNLKALEPVIGIGADIFMKNLKDYPLDIHAFPERIKHIRNIIQKNLFSICFCENALNETLWLKYANNYKGFALIYDMRDSETFLCGKEDTCQNCLSAIEKPGIYPVYYTDEAYNATKFALASLLWEKQEKLSPQLLDLSYRSVVWEAERISLIKKKCHKYDEEWRMIRPSMSPNRTCIKMRPCKVLLGMRMPEYERALVTAAAKCAGISIIEELYINDLDILDSKAI